MEFYITSISQNPISKTCFYISNSTFVISFFFCNHSLDQTACGFSEDELAYFYKTILILRLCTIQNLNDEFVPCICYYVVDFTLQLSLQGLGLGILVAEKHDSIMLEEHA